jgi:hypothetical protein
MCLGLIIQGSDERINFFTKRVCFELVEAELEAEIVSETGKGQQSSLLRRGLGMTV